ncbi:hypothetical protein F5Y16DRAFT_329886 [Xylariaceae sp. FL0255]|nr:hypothetical protein F5Y16DRAFT_329886 [Xylariaceae sp. FL0255]
MPLPISQVDIYVDGMGWMTGYRPPIYGVPIDVMITLISYMKIRDVVRFIQTCTAYHNLYLEHKPHILLAILRQLPEHDLLLFLHTARPKDMLPGRMLHPRTISFDFGVQQLESGYTARKTTFLLKTPVAWEGKRLICPKKYWFRYGDLMGIMKNVDVIDWWVDHYPRFHWREKETIKDRRLLTANEDARLRRAIARWWLYSFYFHDQSWRDRATPKRFDEDPRLHHIRVLTTSEIFELKDLWTKVYELVSNDVCSSLFFDHRKQKSELCIWGLNRSKHRYVVRTYMKLNPSACLLRLTSEPVILANTVHQLLKWLLQNYYRYDKETIIELVEKRAYGFVYDVETLSMAIDTVLAEREVLSGHVYPLPPMGIVDRASDDVLEPYLDDAWKNGSAPVPDEVQYDAMYHTPTSAIPRGSNGSMGY